MRIADWKPEGDNEEQAPVEGQWEKGRTKAWWQRILEEPAVDRPLEEYSSHPLNVSGTTGGARIARAAEALMGAAAGTALLDLAIGVLLLIMERRRVSRASSLRAPSSADSEDDSATD